MTGDCGCDGCPPSCGVLYLKSDLCYWHCRCQWQLESLWHWRHCAFTDLFTTLPLTHCASPSSNTNSSVSSSWQWQCHLDWQRQCLPVTVVHRRHSESALPLPVSGWSSHTLAGWQHTAPHSGFNLKLYYSKLSLELEPGAQLELASASVKA